MILEVLVGVLAGGFAGLVRAVITGKGSIALPKIEEKNGTRFLNLGFIAPIIIGVGAGAIAPYGLGVDAVVSFLAGYTGVDFIENLIERRLGLPKKVVGG